MLLPVALPCTPPAITVQAKPETATPLVRLATAGIPDAPGVVAPSASSAPPRSVRPFDHLGACFMPFVPAVPSFRLFATVEVPALPRYVGPPAASPRP